MDELIDAALDALAASDVATALRVSRWGYAVLSTVHVLALSTLFGTVLALDLALIGGKGGRAMPIGALRRLSALAGTGLALALASGALLFSVRAPEYAALGVFRVKLALVALGSAHALGVHATGGLARLSRGARRRVGLVSLACWSGALVCGRLIAFVGD